MTDKRSQSDAIVVDLDRCLACKACETACARAHSEAEDMLEALLEGKPLVPRVRVIAAADKAVPVQCQQCEDAPCVEVCPSGALYKDETSGRTLTAAEKCIGCHACVVVCPFGAVSWSTAEERIVKCDLCEGVVEEGEAPSCVAACPTHARRVVRLEELARDRQKESARRTVLAAETEETD